MHSLNVISYNMGTNIRDFAWECEYLKKKISDDEIGQKMYKDVQDNTAKSLSGRASVYLLQEVDREDRPLIDSLKLAGCAIFHILNRPDAPEKTRSWEVFDCAIALKLDEFEAIENHSKTINGYDTAIVTATYKQTQERITFVSGHVPGLKLDENEFFKADLIDGDKYCQSMIDAISGDSVIHIIGADMNANPEVLKKIKVEREWRHRFEKLADAHFLTCRTGKPTNVKPDSDYCKRELDFIFVRTLSTTRPALKPNHKLERLLKWDISLNASDHRPILAKFSFI